MGTSDLMSYEEFLLALVGAHREYENIRRVYRNPPVAPKYRQTFQAKNLPRLVAAQKAIDDLVLKRATEIRKERKAQKEQDGRDGAQDES